jgi:hypothetical protein
VVDLFIFLPPRLQTLCGFAASVWILPSWPACRQAGQEGSFGIFLFNNFSTTNDCSDICHLTSDI